MLKKEAATVDGRNPANQLRLVDFAIIYKVLFIPGGCLGFLPSTVWLGSSTLWTFREIAPQLLWKVASRFGCRNSTKNWVKKNMILYFTKRELLDLFLLDHFPGVQSSYIFLQSFFLGWSKSEWYSPINLVFTKTFVPNCDALYCVLLFISICS